MDRASRLSQLVSWITSTPDHVPDDMVRYYVYWKVFYILAGLAHAQSMLTFLNVGVMFMFYFNIFSVTLFIAASLLLRAGRYRLAYWGALTELVLHGIAATVCVGYEQGYQNYAFLVVVLLFIQPFYSRTFSIFMSAATLASAGLVVFYSLNNPPVYQIDESWAQSQTVSATIIWPIFVLIMVLPFVAASARAEKQLNDAYAESERLLLNILPAPIAERLKTTGGMIADDHERVAVLFADLVGFTDMSSRLQPAEVVSVLNEVFNAIDDLVAKYGVEKIKTIGDAYMVVAGLPTPIADPNETIARLALEIQDTVKNFTEPGSDRAVSVRIGINAGKVVAGVIGNRKFAYDLWGDTVNVAARMEASGEAGRIQVTDEFAAGLADRFTFEPRGEIDIKGKGMIATSFLVGEKPA